MNHIVLDLEWNQARVPALAVTKPFLLKGEIFQIGAVMLDESFEPIDTFNALVKPVYYRKLHGKVKQLTGISHQKLESGESFRTAVTRFFAWCGTCDIFTWGPDDIPMLRDNLVIHKLSPDVIPPHFDLQLIYDDQITHEHRQFSLAFAAENVGESLNGAHDALADAEATALLCRHLDMKAGMEKYNRLYDGVTPPSVFSLRPQKTYPSKKALISEVSGQGVDHPLTGKLTLSPWVNASQWKLIASAQNSKSESFFVELKLSKKENRWQCVLTVHPLNARLRALLENRRAAV